MANIVLMASYHKNEQLWDCLSVLQKARKFKEFDKLIIYDNMSGWDTVSVIEHFVITIPNVQLVYGDKNIGKARAINQLVKTCVDPEDTICIMDADIQVEHDTLKRLFLWANHFDQFIVLPEHTGSRCHLYEKNHRNIRGIVKCPNDIKNTVGAIAVAGGVGVAGACMTMKAATFIEAGGFEANSVYGGNEVGLYKKFCERYKDGTICVLGDAKVYHPEETDRGYQEWKIKCQRDIRRKGKCDRPGYYDRKKRESVE